MKPKKICVVTGSRAEFHLLKYLILELKREKIYQLVYWLQDLITPEFLERQ